MRVLWVCNTVPLPAIAADLGVSMPVVGGWMTGLATQLSRRSEIDLAVCFPLVGIGDVAEGHVDGVDYYAFPAARRVPFLDVVDELGTPPALRRSLDRIIQLAGPDLLHVFGTEYAHALVAAQAFGRPDRTLVNIQGLTSVIARHFLGSLPARAVHRWAVSNLVRGDLAQQRRRLEKRGEVELRTLRAAGHLLGRTTWDRALSAQLNPDAAYHHCAPALRDSFYEGSWDPSTCEPGSILFVQGSNPLKGLYYLIEALPEILRTHPEAHVDVVGNDPTASGSLYARLKRSSYGGYLAQLLRSHRLEEKVRFLGPLSEGQMRDRMLRSHVFVSASTIENESNALCEARLLGVPSVASFVGGVTSVLRHEQDGFAYQHDAPYMLAHYVKELLDRPDLCLQFSGASRAAAHELHDREAIGDRQAAIYRAVIEQNGVTP
ncbi:MAG TPA: glycosyltransferase [Propionibacteriaceae bacterium]|nr:glycosyltransferase [Propionibacteriaceae bacterium]